VALERCKYLSIVVEGRRVFQAQAAATEIAQSPSVDWQVDRSTGWPELALQQTRDDDFWWHAVQCSYMSAEYWWILHANTAGLLTTALL